MPSLLRNRKMLIPFSPDISCGQYMPSTKHWRTDVLLLRGQGERVANKQFYSVPYYVNGYITGRIWWKDI